MVTPDVIENCNSASLNSQVSAVSCALDQLNKKFGSGSLKILQDGYVDITMGSLTDNYSSPWTVECWFYPTAVGSSDGWLFNQDDNIDGSLAWYVRLKASSITLGIRGQSESSTVSIAYNEWHHLRVTHAGDKLLKLYLDGALLDSKTFATETDPRIRFGKPYTIHDSDINRWYTGNIDEIAFTVLNSSNVAEYSGDTAPVPTEGYPDEVRSPGIVIDGLFLSTSKPKANQKGLLVNNKFFIPFAESSGGDTSAFESDAMAIIGTPTEEGGDIEPISQKYMTVTSTDDVGCGVGIEFTGTIQIVEDGVATLYTTSPISNIALRNATVYGDNITYFNCGSTNLASVDPSHNDQLVTLICSNGYLTALDISNNSLLTTLEANSNNLSSAVVDKILSDLVAHGKSNGLLRLENSAGIGAASNGAPTSQNNVTTLQSRGWTVTTA